MSREPEYGISWWEAWAALRMLEELTGAPARVSLFAPREARGAWHPASVKVSLGDGARQIVVTGERYFEVTWGKGGQCKTIAAALWKAALVLAGELEPHAFNRRP